MYLFSTAEHFPCNNPFSERLVNLIQLIHCTIKFIQRANNWNQPITISEYWIGHCPERSRTTTREDFLVALWPTLLGELAFTQNFPFLFLFLFCSKSGLRIRLVGSQTELHALSLRCFFPVRNTGGILVRNIFSLEINLGPRSVFLYWPRCYRSVQSRPRA